MAATKEAPSNLHQRLRNVMQQVSYLQKEKKPGMKYSINSHDTVTEKTRPNFLEQGIIHYPVSINQVQNGNRTEIELTERFVNVDDPSDFIDVVSLGHGVDQQDKGPGKAISYAVKYAVLKVLALPTGDDPDLEQGEESNHRKKPSPETQRQASGQRNNNSPF